MKKLEICLLLFIILGAFIVRLYRFNGPVADWHSWRQADTSAVSRNFAKYGFDLLHPKFEDISNVASGLDNPKGYRFVEFPIYNFATAFLYKLFGHFNIEEWGRLVTIFSSCFSIIFIYLLLRKRRSATAGILGALFFAFIPYSIYYGRTILPDESMVTASLASTYFFDKWLTKNFQFFPRSGIQLGWTIFNFQFLLALVFTALALLLKPYALFFTLPVIYLAWERFGFGFLKKWQLWLFLILSTLPLIFWRLWMLKYPEGIPASAWLFNGGNIRFKGAFFYWLFADRIARLILGFWGLPLFVLGILSLDARHPEFILGSPSPSVGKVGMPKSVSPESTRGVKVQGNKNNLFFWSFLLSAILYLFVIARGNVQHDYYQILIIPAIVIFLAFGSEFLLVFAGKYFNRIICYFIFVICLLFMFAFGWYFVRAYFNINNPSIVVAGMAVNKLTPANAKIIAPYGGDTSFLYQTKRQGWASFEKPLPQMIKMGADYLVLVNPGKKDYQLGKTYKIVASTKDYILFNLRERP